MTAVIFCLTTAALADDTPAADQADTDKKNELQQKFNDLQAKIAELQAKLSNTKEKHEKELDKLKRLQSELENTNTQLIIANRRLKNTNEDIQDVTKQISSKEINIKSQNDIIAKRLRDVYKNKDVDYIDMAISSKDPSDFMNRYYLIEKVLSRDNAIITSLINDYSSLRQSKSELDRKKAKTQRLLEEIAAKKKYQATLSLKQSEIVNKLETDKDFYESAIRQFEAQSQEIAKFIVVSTKKSNPTNAQLGSGFLGWPLLKHIITSEFGTRIHPIFKTKSVHHGLDIAGSTGDNVKAADGGRVIRAGWYGVYGNVVMIDHGHSISTLYGHLSKIYVREGNRVEKGDIIGAVGSTGYSTGAHLHFEVRLDGIAQNPRAYLP